MLKIKEILHQQAPNTREVDFYVPVKVEFPENDDGKSELLHYRLMNTDASFLELSVNVATGKFTSITLVSVNAIENAPCTIEDAFPPMETGNPIVDMETSFEKPVTTAHMDISLYWGNRCIYALWGQERAMRQIALGGVRLLIDAQNDLAGVVFHGFSEAEWEEVGAGVLCAMQNAQPVGG
ncbi:MAG: hypothetical protein Q4C72_09620 [Eubacteriales bacterium]|nr:hypothetical protein [Eubacteriales bacterium]